MRVGFSFSPGGLLLPYHMGVMSSLSYYNQLDDTTPIAGSSAGAIAVAAHSCGLDPLKVLDATISVSDQCEVLGQARGNLLPLLNEQLEEMITDEIFHNTFQNRIGTVGVAYKEVFPKQKNYLQTRYTSRDDLFKAVSYSCMFPFFATKWPCILDTNRIIPRLLVDGFFTVPRDRFGCPDFNQQTESLADDSNNSDDTTTVDVAAATSSRVDRTVAVSCLPKERLRIHAFDDDDIICPSEDSDLGFLFRVATEATSKQDLTQIYENGWNDGEQWCWNQQQEAKNQKQTKGLRQQLSNRRFSTVDVDDTNGLLPLN